MKKIWLALLGGLAVSAVTADIKVTDFLPNDGKDVADGLQKLIDDNPNTTIYFPDGVYLLSKPILTPADPKRSVALHLANYAIIRATSDWKSSEAMIRLGASCRANDIRTPGSNYGFEGGIIDGNNVAKGISIDGGRETKVRNVSMKRVFVGLHIKHGANSGSSDCDIVDVNIVGNRATNSIGVLVEGYDNTFTNMRIADCYTGVKLISSGNSLRNLHPLFTCGYEVYPTSVGFDDIGGNNWFDFCYSDHYSIGFRMSRHGSVYDKCFTMWYAANPGLPHTALLATGKFNTVIHDLTIGFNNREAINTILKVGEDGGKGIIDNLRVNVNCKRVDDCVYEKYFMGRVF